MQFERSFTSAGQLSLPGRETGFSAIGIKSVYLKVVMSSFGPSRGSCVHFELQIGGAHVT